MTADELLSRLVALPPEARDAEVERLFNLTPPKGFESPPSDQMVGYHASHLAFVVRALIAAEVGPDDVFIDIGSGMGKVTTLARVLTGARVRGIEYVGALVDLAPRVDGVEYVHGDARQAPLDDGTVFFLYAPFTGALRREVFARLHAVAKRRGIAVCAMAFDAEREWLQLRAPDQVWLQVFHSQVEGVAARPAMNRTVDPRMVRLANAEPALSAQ